MAENRLEIGTDWEEAFHAFENVIAHEREVSQIKAILKLAALSKNVPQNVLARTVPVLVELFGSPSNDSNPLIREAAAYCLNQIARQGDGELGKVIGQAGVFPSLLRLLPQSEGRFRRLLIKFLWVLVTVSSSNWVIVARNGGLEIVINMTSSCLDETRQFLLEILSALALLREVRRVIIGFGGLPLLVESARTGSSVSRARAVQTIGLLGQTRRVKQTLVDLNVIPILIELLREGDNPMKLIAGNSLGIMASHIDYIRPVAQAGAIPLYVELLQGSEPLGREIAEDVFCILAVVEMNAISITEHLVRILQGDNEDAKSAAADVLWDLSTYTHTMSVVRESGAIPILVELLHNGNGDLKEKVSATVAQLSYDVVCRRELADIGVIPLLINLLQSESEELKDNAAETLINFSEDPLLCDRVSEVFAIPSFHSMQSRLLRLRTSDEHMARSFRRMSIERFTGDPSLF